MRFSAFTACVAVLATSAFAQPSPKEMPDRVTVAGAPLRLNGIGLCEYGIFAIDVYWGALYLERPTRVAKTAIESEQRKRIHLHFVRSLTREQLARAFTAAVEYNAGKAVGRYRAALRQLCAMMEPVTRGESIVFDYVPARGIEVRIDGKSKGWLRDRAFSRLFFVLYLGPHPPDDGLKRGMLSGRRGG